MNANDSFIQLIKNITNNATDDTDPSNITLNQFVSPIDNLSWSENVNITKWDNLITQVWGINTTYTNLDQNGSFETPFIYINESDGGSGVFRRLWSSTACDGDRTLQIYNMAGGHTFRFFSTRIDATQVTCQGRIRNSKYDNCTYYAPTPNNDRSMPITISLWDDITNSDVGQIARYEIGDLPNDQSWVSFQATLNITPGHFYSWRVSLNSFAGQYTCELDALMREVGAVAHPYVKGTADTGSVGWNWNENGKYYIP